jgi:UDP-N-acetylglucosamine--N-acetylmuramyl-(pentapeptide) pyrophosphoryl-undecaprenol N-acetylglucosamine transferase
LTIILTGGGSGGHITPILAVAAELKKRDPNIQTVYIGQRGDRFALIAGDDENIDQLILVRAGKFRRFHGEGARQFLNLPVMLKNARDFFYVLIGSFQSFVAIRQLKPAVVFSRGGYVSVPVAFGAKLNHVPYITHDSDLVPSLANRIIAPWAAVHAVALPKELYPYPSDSTLTTGIPINRAFKPVGIEQKNAYRKKIGLSENAKLLFVIGGGLGSQTINEAIIDDASNLLAEFSDLHIYHVAGVANQELLQNEYNSKLTEAEQGRVKVFDFINDVYVYSGAADVIVTRAGATNLAEFAVQGKACIVIPSSFLTGGHQIKNAEYLATGNAAVIVREDHLSSLPKAISDLLKDKKKQQTLGENFSRQAITDATERIAELIIDMGQEHEAKA